ncbi:MAG TPA: hypothetical protein VF007_03980 [Stellaceae bacterium]
MAFAKLSGSLLDSDARPARAPEQSPVPAPPRTEERVAPAADPRDILERLARLAEAAPCYDSLWEFIRTGDEEGVARVVAELVRAGRSVSEISDVVEGLSRLIGSAGPDQAEKPGDLLQPGGAPEFVEAPPDLRPGETGETETLRADNNPVAAIWAANPDPVPEPATDSPPQAEDDTATWSEPTRISAEPAIIADAELHSAGGPVPALSVAFPSAKAAPPPSSARAYIGAALAGVLAIAGAGAFLISQPAVKQVGAATALPADAGAKLAAPPTGGVTPPADDSAVARPAETAKTGPVPPPAPAAPVPPPSRPLATPLASATPPVVPPEAKKAETAPVALQNAAPIAAVTVTSAATPAPVPAGAGGERPQPKPPAPETDVTVKTASVVPGQPDQPAPAAPTPAPAARTPPDRAASDRAEPSPVVASLEPPKNSPAAIAPSIPPPPVGAPVSAAVEPREAPPMPVDTAPLLERGDRLFGTGEVASARLFYERAADAGDGQAALRLGETYDPAFLQRAQLRVAGDRGLAMFWYGRARELGADEADILLKGMQSR